MKIRPWMIGVAALSLAVVGLGRFCFGPLHPSDQELKARFDHHQKDFDDLVALYSKDRPRIDRIDARLRGFARFIDGKTLDRESSEDALPDEWWKQYEQFFSLLDLDGGIQDRGDELLLIASNSGLSGGGSSKGYSYLKQPPPQESILENLDQIDTGQAKAGIRFKPLRGNWYLYYDWYY